MQQSSCSSQDVRLHTWSTLDSRKADEVSIVSGLCTPCNSRSYRVGKRAFDLICAIALLPVILPLCLVLIFWIKCRSVGPALYRHQRVGQNGRSFYLYKLRTMAMDSERTLISYLACNLKARHEWEQHHKLSVDPRVTPWGAVLRRLSLDELPQIWNVLLGDMSFVGPRPIVTEEMFRYGDDIALYIAAKPGITGLWQVSGRGTLSYEKRVSLDVEYISTWSLVRDLKIILKTPHAIRTGQGAL